MNINNIAVSQHRQKYAEQIVKSNKVGLKCKNTLTKQCCI